LKSKYLVYFSRHGVFLAAQGQTLHLDNATLYSPSPEDYESTEKAALKIRYVACGVLRRARSILISRLSRHSIFLISVFLRYPSGNLPVKVKFNYTVTNNNVSHDYLGIARREWYLSPDSNQQGFGGISLQWKGTNVRNLEPFAVVGPILWRLWLHIH
jgi:hypothetical protein